MRDLYSTMENILQSDIIRESAVKKMKLNKNIYSTAHQPIALNGFYMVKKPTKDGRFMHIAMLGVVYCTFQQEGNFKSYPVEKTLMPSLFTFPFL